MQCYEQGPIRPPSESGSLLVRVSRNCPWNRCAFCPVYKSETYSRRTVEEVLADLDAMREEYGDTPRTVFVQDADPVLVRTDDLVRVIEGIRERFPKVRRITAYARSRTLAKRRLADLVRLRDAGLDRVHCGLESGSDAVLALISKGVTRAEQIEGGQKAKSAGFELSEYVMPGLGGRALSAVHADETASAVVAIAPDFVRLRTTAVIPGTPLAELEQSGAFEACGEREMVVEVRRLLGGLEGWRGRLESDHMLNLLMELRGTLPDALPELLAICDRFLAMSAGEQDRFIVARRLGWMGFLEHFLRPEVRARLDPALDEAMAAHDDTDLLAARLRRRMV